jgi:hypothetical protein
MNVFTETRMTGRKLRKGIPQPVHFANDFENALAWCFAAANEGLEAFGKNIEVKIEPAHWGGFNRPLTVCANQDFRRVLALQHGRGTLSLPL